MAKKRTHTKPSTTNEKRKRPDSLERAKIERKERVARRKAEAELLLEKMENDRKGSLKRRQEQQEEDAKKAHKLFMDQIANIYQEVTRFSTTLKSSFFTPLEASAIMTTFCHRMEDAGRCMESRMQRLSMLRDDNQLILSRFGLPGRKMINSMEGSKDPYVPIDMNDVYHQYFGIEHRYYTGSVSQSSRPDVSQNRLPDVIQPINTYYYGGSYSD